MKRVAKFMSIILIMAVVSMACNKDDDNLPVQSTKLSAVKYTPNKLEGKVNGAFTSKEAAVTPKNASVTFKISKITKDKKAFTNPKQGGFKINSKGIVSAAKDHKLGAGTYALTITAATKKNKKDKKGKVISKTTTLTVVISGSDSGKLSSVNYKPSKLKSRPKMAFSTQEALVNPKNTSVTFEISKITKDKKSFTNPKNGGFNIDAKGKVSGSKDHKLGAGTYELTITATDKKDKENKKTATLKIAISELNLASIGYTPNKLESNPKTKFESKVPQIKPSSISVTFELSKITKDKKDYTNPKDGGFSIDSKGVISAPKDHKLAKGTYVLTIAATNSKNKKNKKTTTFTVVIK